MEFFENQVGEVRYLTTLAETETPASIPPASPASQHRYSAGPTNAGAKRKNSADESPGSKGAPQQRSKRNRYISIACNECKRRKIKCNGETPCQRCGNLNLQCLYSPNCCTTSLKDSEEFKQMATKVNQLQEQVETLFANMNSLQSEALRLAPIQDQPGTLPSASSTPSISSIPSITPVHRIADLPQPRPPAFRGPTSYRFNLDVAKNTLHKMGYSNPSDGGDPDNFVQDTPGPSPNILPQLSAAPQRPPQDPLWEFDKDELVRLCRLHDEEVGIMYPVVKIESVVSHARILSSWMEAARKNFQLPGFGQEGGIKDHNTLLLKLVVCCALQVEEHGNSEKAQRLFNSVRPTTDRMLMSDPSDVKNMPLLALVAGYHFLASDEILGWRTIGQVARLCFELGLHRCDAIQRIRDEQERKNAINTFWAAFVLDRRWAFGTGLPYTVPDEEIDPLLPYPDSHPFLVAMINYSKLSARVWRLVRNFEPNAFEFRPSDIEELDCSIKKWYTEVPPENQLELADWEALPTYINPTVHSQREYDIQRLQIWTYLRLNQIRTWLYTPILHTHSSIMENLVFAERVVKLAKNTICYLTHLNNTTNIYRKIQVFYHQFLLSAIAVLFLASCHAPVNFSSSCRNEFYMALELVKDMSSKSWVSRRLWSTIKSLREVAPRLGLAHDPHSSAALTMAGLATGQMAAATPPVAPGYGSQPSPVPGAAAAANGVRNGHQISTEMSRIFEDYMGKNGSPGDPLTPVGAPPLDDGAGAPFAAGGSVYQHLKDMF
ncbi:hypothetical protein GGR53DRAFT_491773 [Hypoxylon sp. FL1150]|nr:hypothetical protein GGR53DRAFT_491773 [Hypoxylon sp. FL1150]